MKRLFLLLTAFLMLFEASAEEKKEIVKTGLNFGPLPIIAFDQDKGLEYGAILNIFNFGDGSTYPNPKSQWYFEAAFYTKGSQIFRITYDDRTLIPGVRMSAAIDISNDKALDFYGFNGYQSYYDSSLPSGYYRMGRVLPYAKVDFTGKIAKNLYWKAGYHFKYFKIKSFESESLKPVMGYNTFFDLYKGLGLISEEDADGGVTSAVRVGIMYDSRDVENAPTKGIWAEANAEYAPKFLGTSKDYLKYHVCARGYLPLFHKKLILAGRTTLEGFAGTPAFYALPFDLGTGTQFDRDGFGGYRTIRGMIRNRLVAKSVFYWNAEARWSFVNFQWIKQNFALCLSGFCDGGSTVEEYPITGLMPFHAGPVYKDAKDGFHFTAGGGFRLIMNHNFIIAVEYGHPINRKELMLQDNMGGSFYVNTGFLF
ncbi:MAG: BamA/TamA family outer membrane protein [Bacteroidales bacterium]|nr:BamA/TamA family outer membrane protein [Candidatus Cacconaster merdequi]